MDEGRLGMVFRQEERHRKFVYMMNDIVRSRLSLYSNYLAKEQHDNSIKLVKNCVEVRRTVVRQKVLRQCLEMRKRKLQQRSQRNNPTTTTTTTTINNNTNNTDNHTNNHSSNHSSGRYGQYGGTPLWALSRDMERVLAENHPRVRRMKRVQQAMRHSRDSGAILDQETVARRMNAFFQINNQGSQQGGGSLKKKPVRLDDDDDDDGAKDVFSSSTSSTQQLRRRRDLKLPSLVTKDAKLPPILSKDDSDGKSSQPGAPRPTPSPAVQSSPSSSRSLSSQPPRTRKLGTTSRGGKGPRNDGTTDGAEEAEGSGPSSRPPRKDRAARSHEGSTSSVETTEAGESGGTHAPPSLNVDSKGRLRGIRTSTVGTIAEQRDSERKPPGGEATRSSVVDSKNLSPAGTGRTRGLSEASAGGAGGLKNVPEEEEEGEVVRERSKLILPPIQSNKAMVSRK